MKSYTCLTVILCVAVLMCTGCTVSNFDSSHLSTAQVSERLHPQLPFASTFPNRWNQGNDGTEYEPCVAVTGAVAERLGLDPASIEDAATVDHQTARGCRWRDHEKSPWSVSQIVGNQASLAAYKSQNRSLTWRPDLEISGRQVAVSEINSTTCVTHVQSSGAGVSTLAQYISANAPPIDEICDRAIAFTRATIDKMPR
ncbi:DUF3558 family protein [Gordonia sp. TBRC 11910]|uniref:DUF3558 family protein n=1 Tax=Gordonia asplenii TaxID=2725283 RepID=A0A848L9Q2_9ACTN|nr:DUF3558 family protein [Gordonia asplenii]